MDRRLQNLNLIERFSGFSGEDGLELHLGETLRILPGRREVYRARLIRPELEVVAKCYLAHPKQARDWHREWTGLTGLHRKGLPVPKPLAVAQGSDGVICVLMEYIPSADTLGTYLESIDSEGRWQIMERLAVLVDRLHAAGARQTDQHIDNWVTAQGALYLLDAGTYTLSSDSLGKRGRLDDLSAICATLPPAAELDFRKALRSKYALDLSEARPSALLGEALSRNVGRVQRARVRRYYKKTLRACTEFGLRRSGAWFGMFSNSANAQLVDRFFENPDALMVGGERLKSGNTCTVQRIEANGKTYVLKRYNKRKWWVQLRRSLFPSRARKSWSNAWVLNLSFIPTARPVAFADEEGLPRGRSYLLMEEIKGALLPDYVARLGENLADLETLIEQVGQIWDLLGRMRAAHGDLKATNWIVDSDGTVFLFDLDSFRFGLSKKAFLTGRQKDLRRFLRNWKSSPVLADAFRQRMKLGLNL